MRLGKVKVLSLLSVPDTVPPVVTAGSEVRVHHHWYPVMAIFLSIQETRFHVTVMLLRVVAVTKRSSGVPVGAVIN